MKKITVTQPPRQNNYEEDDSSVGCGCCMTKHPTLDEFFGQITEDSSAHGIKYVGSKKLHPIERIFWVFVLLASIGFAIHLAMNVYFKFQDSPVIVSFQAQETSISRIPFPAITICNVNMLKTSVLTKHYDNLTVIIQAIKAKTINFTDEILETISHLDRLSQYCLMATSFRRYLNDTLQDANGRPDFADLLNSELDSLNADQTGYILKFEHASQWTDKEQLLFKEATLGCREMLLKCKWAGQLISCRDIFFPIETRNGRCCVYNMMPRYLLQVSPDGGATERANMPKKAISEWTNFAKRDLIVKNAEEVANITYPKHQKSGGKPYGLTVLVNPDLSEYSTCNSNDGWGFKIVAHSPLSAPSIMDYGAAIPPNSEVFVDVEPDVTIADAAVLGEIPFDKRGCYLSTDFNAQLNLYNYYSRENCYSECVTEHTLKNCSCARFFMPRNENQSICGAAKRKCAMDINANLTRNFGPEDSCDHCMPPCTDIKYKLQLSHFDLRMENATAFEYDTKIGDKKNATDYSIIHIYMGADSIYAKERKIIFGWFDLIANAGGLLSLTLGVSIISFVEVGYFFTLRAWFQFRSVRKRNRETDNNQHSEDNGKDRGVFNKREHFVQRRRSSITTAFGKNTAEYYNWAAMNKLGMINAAESGADKVAVVNGRRA